MKQRHANPDFPAGENGRFPADRPEACPGADVVKSVITAFGLGELLEVSSAGGTASLKWAVVTGNGRFMIRIRPAEFASEEATHFDHEALRRLREAGLPVPKPIPRPDGSTWLRLDGKVYEVLGWITGEPWNEADPDAPAAIGSFLCRFHTTLSTGIRSAGKGRPREDHPDLISGYLNAASALACTTGAASDLKEVRRQLDLVRAGLDGGLYESLPRCVIHGDFHPGNIRFSGSQVAALYDFDYVDVQARARDLSDAIMFFASRRKRPFHPDDIRSLTQPMVPDIDRARRLIAGYQSGIRINDLEWSALPLLIRSRWLQMRLRGARKVPEQEKIDFILGCFFEVTDWLDRDGPAFFNQLRHTTQLHEE